MILCNCEHSDHEAGGHSVPAGTQRADYVGAICDACASTHLAEYLLDPHNTVYCAVCDEPHSVGIDHTAAGSPIFDELYAETEPAAQLPILNALEGSA